MYKKRNRTPMIITAVVMVLVIAAIAGLQYYKRLKMGRSTVMETEQMETETEALVHDVLIYKTGDASVEFESRFLKKDTDSESILAIEQDTLVTILVTPKQGKKLESVDLVDYDFNEINHFLRTTSGDEIRVNFVMPDTDVILNFNFSADDAAELEYIDTETEPETESETEGNPYGLTLKGLTADIIVSYNGQFDDRDFLQQLGDALHMDSARSEYASVKTVTFSTEEYTGAKDSDKVYNYLYFDDDPEWKGLSTYYMNEDSYIFTEPAEETEDTDAAAWNSTAAVQGSTGGSYTGGSTGGSTGENYYGGGSAGTQSAPITTVTTTSFDILQVSTNLLTYVGDQEEFYQKAFDYVLESGLTGKIEGTLSSYEIDAEKMTAVFKIALNTGDTIEGSYNKEENAYTFTGL